MSSLRTFLYSFARLLGDLNAVKRGTVAKRLERRVVGRVAGKLLGMVFR